MVKVCAIVLPLVLTGCAAARARPATSPQVPRPFIITAWCAPPLEEFNDARAEEIAAAGFNIVGPPCEGSRDRESNLRALDVAARHGLRMWIDDPRFSAEQSQYPDWEAPLAAAVADYRQHPALDGYFVHDEPTADQFESVAKVVDRLRAADPAHLAYVNLLPDYVLPKGLKADSYADYVERFATGVRPELLSYDYYPFGKKQQRSSFFTNLATMRDVAQRHRVPFMLIVQVMPHGPYRNPTEAEISWQVFHALAFGARGISYFAYWTPFNVEGRDEWKFRYGLIEQGKPTLHYFRAARLNRVVRAIAAQLAAYDSLAVADSSGESGAAFPIGPIAAIDGGPVTAGLFVDPAGHVAVLLVNRDYRYGVTATLRLRADAQLPSSFDATTERWTQATALAFTLAPGDARLLRWGDRPA